MNADDGDRLYVGQLLCGGFEGKTVTPQAYHLITELHVSTMILLKKNTVSVEQISKLIKDLQHIARTQANYKYPLIFAVDEEGGMMNSLFDEINLTQFPGAMALAATGDAELVYKVLKAIAIELKHIGFSVILGPVLDVITKLSHQLVGVRSFGTTIEEVTKYGKACAKGLKDGGLLTVGKHFPGIGNASVDSLLELPMMADSLEQIKSFNSVPFAELIKDDLVDGISVAGCGVPSISPDETHACLSPILINQYLRQELGFEGFVISECLEMDALYHSIGLGQGVILAIYAGCDLVMVCHNLALQNEAVKSMEIALENGNLDEEIIVTCLNRIEKIQKQLPSWAEILNEGKEKIEVFPIKYPDLWKEHQELLKVAYRKSITLVRDYTGTLPISKFFKESKEKEKDDKDNLLILSPLLNPIYPTSDLKTKEKTQESEESEESSDNESSNDSKPSLFTGEEVFQKFGRLLSEHPSVLDKSFNVLHTTYTANGLTALHETLIENSKVVIVLTSEALRNMYQIGIVKYVSILCGASPSSFNNGGINSGQLVKPLVIVATSSPYDFFYNKSIGSAYLCSYDYTNRALEELVGILMGDSGAEGCIPGEKKFSSRIKKRKPPSQPTIQSSPIVRRKSNPQPKRRWLVDEFNIKRDWSSLIKLWKNNLGDEDINGEEEIKIDYQRENFYKKLLILLSNANNKQKHFVVRNSSLNLLYGIVLTWVNEYQQVSLNEYIEETTTLKTGSIMYLLVDKLKRLQSIGKNLHARALRYLIKEQECDLVTLGCSVPNIVFPENSHLVKNNKVSTLFMNSVGWEIKEDKRKNVLILKDLMNWSVPQKIFRELMIVGVRFDICNQPEKLMELIERCTKEEGDDEKTAMTKQLYMEAVKYLQGTTSYEVKIIIALEPTNQNIIGSIILFTNQLAFAKFYPYIDEAIDESIIQESKRIVGGMVEPMIDPSYSNLTEIFKFGLICSGITFFKSNFGEDTNNGVMDECLIFRVDQDKSMTGIKEIGFSEWKWHYEYYDKQSSDNSLFNQKG